MAPNRSGTFLGISNGFGNLAGLNKRSKGIRQRPINWCTPPMMIQNITSSVEKIEHSNSVWLIMT